MPRIWADFRKGHALKVQTILIKRRQPDNEVCDTICNGKKRHAYEDKHYD